MDLELNLNITINGESISLSTTILQKDKELQDKIVQVIPEMPDLTSKTKGTNIYDKCINIIDTLIKKYRWSQREIAQAMGYKSVGSIQHKISKKIAFSDDNLKKLTEIISSFTI